MANAKGVVFAFSAIGKPGKTAAHAHGVHARPTSGQNLVAIGLVTDIPDELVSRSVEHIVQRNGQFDSAEAGTEVPTGIGYRPYHVATQLFGQGWQGVLTQLAKISRMVELVQQRKVRIVHRVKSQNVGQLSLASRARARLLHRMLHSCEMSP